MDKAQFWKTIADCRKEEGRSDDVFLENIRTALDKMTVSDIIGFQAYLNTYMDAIKFPAMLEAAALINKSCTPDGFEYFRAWLVSQGEDTYYKAFQDPDSLYNHPKLRQDPLTHSTERCELESFLYEPMEAYKDVTGSLPDDEYYRIAYEMENDIAQKYKRELSCDECMNIYHKPEELEMAYPELSARCHKLGYDPKEARFWPNTMPAAKWCLQM